MNEMTVGIRLAMETGISFFGLAEVNKAIQEGKRVIAVKEGDGLVQKIGEDEQNVK